MTNKTSLILISALLLLFLPNPVHAQDPNDTPSTAQGRTLWVENCQPCHGSAGKGDGPSATTIPDPLPDFTDPEIARQLVPAENFEVIKNGRIEKLMPPWGNELSDGQIWDATAYVWSLSTTLQDLDAGETLYQAQCAACHGESGAGDGPEASADMLDFTNLEAMAQRSQANLQANFEASEQHAQFNTLATEELWQTLDYIRTFSFAVPEREGVLTGQIINGTTNQPQGDIEVTLHAFQDNVEIVTLTTQADGNGRYVFEKLPTEHTIFYLVEGEYKDVTYVSDEPGIFTPNSTETNLDLKVYETTTNDDEVINIGQLHYILAFTPNVVNVAQIFIVNNNGNRTFIGQDGQTFAFALPDSAANVSFQEAFPGARFIQTDSGYADTAPIPPGAESASIVASYDIPFEADALTLEIPLPTDVASLNVLMSKQGAKLNSQQVQFVETRQIQDDAYEIFRGTNLQEDTLTLQLSNLNDLEFASVANVPGATVPAGKPFNQEFVRWLIIGLGVAAITVAGVVYPLTRPRLAHQSSLDYNDSQTRREKLLLTLVRLDEAFEAGELDERVYRQARAKYKVELTQIMEE